MSHFLGVALLALFGFTAHAPNHHRHHHRRVPHYSAVASVYDAAGGPIACGGNSYGPVVANKTLPCGTKLTICYRGCVHAVVLDRGPYIAGREFDLSRRVENAVGFPYGVDRIHYTFGWH